jgi:hypothetical protein
MNDTLSQAYYLTADSGLIGYWRFDALEDLGVNGDGEDDVRDFSIYGNHADLENGALLVPSQALVSAESIDNIIPENFYLSQNYPNPFNPATIIRYSVPQRSNVTLKVYNVLGNEIVILVSEEKDRGVYIVRFDASNLASGMYLYRLQAGSFVETKKMLFLK